MIIITSSVWESTLISTISDVLSGTERNVEQYVNRHADRLRTFVLAYRDDLRVGSVVQLPMVGAILYTIDHHTDLLIAAASAIGTGKLDDLSMAWRGVPL